MIDMKINPSSWLSLFFLSFFGVAVATAAKWSWDTRLFPYAIGIPAILLALGQLVLDLTSPRRSGNGGEDPTPQIMDITTDRSIPEQVVRRGTAVAFGWILCFVFSIWLIGFLIAVPFFVFFYLRHQAGSTIRVAVTIASLMAIFIWGVFDQIIHTAWPEAALLRLLGFYPG